jgi:hypothetical protein
MTTGLQDALKTGDLLALRAIPKSDLHNHSIGGGNRALVSEWAGRDIAPLKQPLASMAEMDAWIEGQLGSVLNGPKGRLRAFEAAFVQASTTAPRNRRRCVGNYPVRPGRVEINSRVGRDPRARCTRFGPRPDALDVVGRLRFAHRHGGTESGITGVRPRRRPRSRSRHRCGPQ